MYIVYIGKYIHIKYLYSQLLYTCLNEPAVAMRSNANHILYRKKKTINKNLRKVRTDRAKDIKVDFFRLYYAQANSNFLFLSLMRV